MKLRHLLITTGLLVSLGAMAQTANASADTQPNGPVQKMRDMMVKRHARHLEELKTSLKLQPEQEAAWNTFASTMKPHTMQERPLSGADMDKLTTPERIDKMQALQTQHHAEMQKRADATKTFYAGLSDAQKKTFDQHTAKFMRRMGHEHHAGPGHMMH